MKYQCTNSFCFHFDDKRYCWSCGIADRRGSAAWLNECHANRKLKKMLEETSSEIRNKANEENKRTTK